IAGGLPALHHPNSVVITRSFGELLFGDESPLGKNIALYDINLEVTGVLEDVPVNSHLQFDALVSWKTMEWNDSWDNINTYTYIKLHEGASIDKAAADISAIAHDYLREVIEAYDAEYEPIIQNVSDIHLWSYL